MTCWYFIFLERCQKIIRERYFSLLLFVLFANYFASFQSFRK